MKQFLILLIGLSTSLCPGQIIDTLIDTRDNNTYPIVLIGQNWWMAENMDFATESGSWYYLNDESAYGKYGRLYDLEQAQNICCEGWSLPTKQDINDLRTLLEPYEGDKLKSLSFGGTNETGFNALPAGMRSYDGSFGSEGISTHFWNGTAGSSGQDVWWLDIGSSGIAQGEHLYPASGMSVRCLKKAEPYLNVNPNSLNVLPKGDTAFFTIDANITWTPEIQGNETWLFLYKKTDTTLSVIYEANTSDASRTVVISLYGEGMTDSITMTQDAPYLNIESSDVSRFRFPTQNSFIINIPNPEILNVYPMEDSVIFYVDANVVWTIKTDSNYAWLNVLKIDDTSFSAKYNDNLSSESRTGIIIIDGEGSTDTITLTQEDPFLLVTDKNIVIPCLPYEIDYSPYFYVDGNIPISIINSESWLTYSPISMGSLLKVVPNTNSVNIGLFPRYGHLLITTEFGVQDTVWVTQDYCYIDVEPDTLNFLYESGEQQSVNIELRYNSINTPRYGISSQESDWLEIGSWGTSVDLETTEKNLSGQERSLDIIFSCEILGKLPINNTYTLRDTIHVIQHELDYPPLPSEWTVNPADYDYNGSLTARIIIDLDTVQSGYLGAFVGEECRGIGESVYFPPSDQYIFILSLYSYTSSGEYMSFKYCDTVANIIYDLHEEREFNSDMILGNAIHPFDLHYFIEYENTFVPGWNWFSLNILRNDMSINNVLSLEYSHLDYIKNQTQSSLYYDDYGWFGTLDELDPTTLYKARFENIDSINYAGTSINLDTMTIELLSGWNFLGYLPKVTLSIEEALGSLSLTELDYIKNQSGSATYYESTGWFGDLTELSPGDGFMLRLSFADTLKYPSSSGSMKKTSFTERDISGINPHNYEYNGSITAKVFINGVLTGSENDRLYAYVGEEFRGIERAFYFESTDTYVFPIMVYSNISEGEVVRFEYYCSETDLNLKCEEAIIFKNDMIIGNVFNSLNLNTTNTDMTNYTELSYDPKLSVYPNPARNTITICADIHENYSVTITSLNGQRIYNTMMAGNSKQIDISSFSQGVYFITLKSNSGVKTVKVVKI